MGSQRNYVGVRVGSGGDSGHTSWIHLGSVGWCISLCLDILQIPFSRESLLNIMISNLRYGKNEENDQNKADRPYDGLTEACP